MLSKSKILRGIKCEKSLWLYVHKHSEAVVPDSQQAIFNTGTNVGILAREYFPDGQLAVTGDYPNFDSVLRIRNLIQNQTRTIYEATFIADDTLVAVDILTNNNGKWYIYECKSTTSVKKEHVIDVAIQYYVLQKAGIKVEDAFVMYIDNKYVRRGELEIKKLFTSKSVLYDVKGLQEFVKTNIDELVKVLVNEEPSRQMGKHCNSPYPCDFQNYCSLLYPLKDNKQEIFDNTPIIKKEAIQKRIQDYGYPLYFLDFETIMPCIPMFDESRPYQQIPFQYSLHFKASPNSQIEHSEYLAYPEGEPREQLIQRLISDIKYPGKILTYNVAFERTRLNEMARDFPKYRNQLMDIIDRIEDLMPIFRSKEFHAPSMGSGYSIKIVLPLLVPELSYENLEIGNGGDASSEFLNLYETSDEEKINQTRKALLEYCHLDTLAMVRILEQLESSIL